MQHHRRKKVISITADPLLWARLVRVAEARRMTRVAVLEYGIERALAELEAAVDVAGIEPAALPAPPSLELPGVSVAPPTAIPAKGQISRPRAKAARRASTG